VSRFYRFANYFLAVAILIISFSATYFLIANSEETNPAVAVSKNDSFSKPLTSLSDDDNRKFILGKNLFHGTSNDSRTLESRGIGPLYNALTCGDCHGDGGISDPDNSPSLNVKIFNETNPNNIDSAYGSQIQTKATGNYFEEAKIVRFHDGGFRLTNLAFGELDKASFTYSRIAQKVVGLGLVESIPDEHFIANADPDDVDGDGISGEIGYSIDLSTNDVSIARFGTKATEISVKNQSLKASFEDLGLTNSMFGVTLCTEPTNCMRKPEMTLEQEEFLIFYTRTIAPPKSRMLSPQTKQGQKLFNSIGCSSCHTQSIKLERSDLVKSDNTYIHPFSDFLLHSMGNELGDDQSISGRDSDEFRTAPLWGLGLIENVNGSLNLLHDGRAKTIDEAILFHGGESLKSRNKYLELTVKEKKAIISYLASL